MEPRDPFADLADEAAAADAVRRRAQTRWLRHQAAQEATLAGALLDLAESGADVALRSSSGRVHRGRLSTVGEDFVVLDDTWIRLAGVVAVRTAGVGGRDVGAAPGDREPVRRVRFVDALAELAGARPAVVVVPAGGGEPVRGVLHAVGVDVVTLVLDGDERARCVVALDAVAEVAVVG